MALSRSKSVALSRSELTRLTLALVAGVLAVDLLWSLVAGSTGTLAYGIVDLPAHVATCGIVLLLIAALGRPRLSRDFVVGALIASVAIDIDHIPGYLGTHALTGSLPRPYAHCLATVVLLVVVAGMARGRARQVFLGLAFGVAAHLLRDLGTGPGVPLLWPLDDATVLIPYAVYAGALALAAVAVTAQLGSARARGARRRTGVRPLPYGGPHDGS